MTRFILRLFAGALLSFAASIPTLHAQGPHAGSGELAVQAGVSTFKGLGDSKHPTVGVSAAINAASFLQLGVEYSYTGLGSASAYGFESSENLQNLMGVVRVNLIPNPVLVPYVVLAGGMDRLNVNSAGPSLTYHDGIFGGAFGGGAGVSLYLGGGLGLRPEVRYEREQYHNQQVGTVYVSNATAGTRGSLALFYQFGGHRSRHY